MEALTLEEIGLIKQTQLTLEVTGTQIHLPRHSPYGKITSDISVLNAFPSVIFVTSDFQILTCSNGHIQGYVKFPAF